MHTERDIEEIVVILSNLDARLSAAETAISELRQSVDRLSGVNSVQQRSIMNLQDRMTHEGLSILEIIGDIKAQLDPVYWRVMPRYVAFTQELSRFFKRGEPPA